MQMTMIPIEGGALGTLPKKTGGIGNQRKNRYDSHHNIKID